MGAVIIVDRVHRPCPWPGRRWSDGLHRIEAKETVQNRAGGEFSHTPNATNGHLSPSRILPHVKKLAGRTGTRADPPKTEGAAEIPDDPYTSDVVPLIPPTG